MAASAAPPLQLVLFDAPAPRTAAPHCLIISGRTVEYRFARRRRRTIGLSVDADGLAIAAPLRASWRDIEAFVHEKSRWILRCLDEWAGVPKPVRLRGADGETLPLFGEPLRLEVRAGRGSVLRSADRLLLKVRDPQRRASVLAALVRWLRAQTLTALEPRAAHYAARLGIARPRVSVSNARTQWGVCSSSGHIRLSWRLAHVAPALGDYVVAHEVAHLVELNHSKRFWRLVETLYPDWRDARARLEKTGASLPRLAGDR